MPRPDISRAKRIIIRIENNRSEVVDLLMEHGLIDPAMESIFKDSVGDFAWYPEESQVYHNAAEDERVDATIDYFKLATLLKAGKKP